jgi:Fe-S oxidoreductase
MATYKAEFLARHYRGRLRPRSAYAFGLSPWWARIASAAPRLANLFTQTPALARLARSAAGIAPQRQIPAFASETFRSWFSRRGIRNPDRPAVLLFPDTFNNFFHPGTARAAVEVLEEAGFRVTVPRGALCCGRPLYDYGMLGLARRTLTRILGSLRAEIRAGRPMIVLEPSCAAVFRDELLGLFPENEDAQRLSEQTFLLSEFLNRKAEGFVPRRLAGKAIVQAHCHHRAIMTMSDEEALLRRTGLDFEILDSGCCGMAGAFGFERGERYEVSLRCAERVLFPALREAAPGTLVLADGFSCREQIRQGTGRRALHLAEVLAFGL